MVLKISALSECRTRLVVQFSTFAKPWTEPWSGSEKFRFEIWFRTELWHPYFKTAFLVFSLHFSHCGPSLLCPLALSIKQFNSRKAIFLKSAPDVDQNINLGKMIWEQKCQHINTSTFDVLKRCNINNARK